MKKTLRFLATASFMLGFAILIFTAGGVLTLLEMRHQLNSWTGTYMLEKHLVSLKIAIPLCTTISSALLFLGIQYTTDLLIRTLTVVKVLITLLLTIYYLFSIGSGRDYGFSPAIGLTLMLVMLALEARTMIVAFVNAKVLSEPAVA